MVRRLGPADDDRASVCEEAGQTHSVEVSADGGCVVLGCLHIDDETLGGVVACERGDVGVRRAGKVAQPLSASADHAAGEVYIDASAVEGNPPAGSTVGVFGD